VGIASPFAKAGMESVEKVIRKYFGKRGDRVVQDNMSCVKRGYDEIKEVPQDWM